MTLRHPVEGISEKVAHTLGLGVEETESVGCVRDRISWIRQNQLVKTESDSLSCLRERVSHLKSLIEMIEGVSYKKPDLNESFEMSV